MRINSYFPFQAGVKWQYLRLSLRPFHYIALHPSEDLQIQIQTDLQPQYTKSTRALFAVSRS